MVTEMIEAVRESHAARLQVRTPAREDVSRLIERVYGSADQRAVAERLAWEQVMHELKK